MSLKTLKSCIVDVVAVPSSYAVTRRRALRYLLSIGSAAVFAGKKAQARASKAQSDAVVYKIVTFQVSAESIERFLAISTTNAAASRKEPGVIDFEVLIPEDTPNTVIFVETYRNAGASDLHSRSAHFLAFKERAKQAGAKESVVVAKRYRP
jgi:autoinducer 2-degrading protein